MSLGSVQFCISHHSSLLFSYQRHSVTICNLVWFLFKTFNSYWKFVMVKITTNSLKTLQWVWGLFNSASHIIPPSYSQCCNFLLSLVLWYLSNYEYHNQFLFSGFLVLFNKNILYVTFVAIEISNCSYCSLFYCIINYNLCLIWYINNCFSKTYNSLCFSSCFNIISGQKLGLKEWKCKIILLYLKFF